MASIFYKSPALYHLLMRTLHGRHFQDRYRVLSAEVPDGAQVVELCAGDAYLYRHYLAARGVRYLGLDNAPAFIARARAAGIPFRAFDAGTEEIPTAEIVIMQASLYQFHDEAAPLLARMIAAASQKVIVAEPVRNLSSSSNPVIANLARALTRPFSGRSPAGARFDEASLQALFARRPELQRVLRDASGREMTGIFSGLRTTPTPD